MKLELEFASPTPSVSRQFAGETSSANTSEMLQSGIKYAKEGNREAARLLLLRVADAEPKNESAWLWLASISEYPEELLVFLQNVLNVNPTHERALEWQKATKSLLAKTFVERGINASQENQRDFANQCFMQALLHDNQNEMAWLWLASNADSPEEKTSHLQKVLGINPDNETALASLKSLKHQMSQSLLKKANFAAISGERQQARQLLDEAMQNAPDLEEGWILKAYLADDSQEKIACYEKILDLNPENEAAQAGLASLKAIMQKSVSQKSNAETLQEVFATGGSGDFFNVEKSPDFPVEIEQEAAENPESPDARTSESSVEVSPQKFVFRSQTIDNFTPKSFESPTDELDVSFIEEVKSQGGFSDEQADEAENFAPPSPADFESFAEQDGAVIDENLLSPASEEVENFDQTPDANGLTDELEVPADSGFGDIPYPEEINESPENRFFITPEREHETVDQEFQAADSSSDEFSNASNDENSAETGGEMELPAVAAETEPVEDYSRPEGNSYSYETTILEQNYPAQAATADDSENFAPRREVSAHAEALDEDEVLQVADDEAENEEAEEESAIHKTPMQGESFPCPFCYVMNPPQAFVCCSCHLMLSLSDMEMLLSHTEARPEVLEMAIEDLEAEKASRPLNETELTNLGIAYLNAKNLRKGLQCLQEAAQMNPNDIVLASKVNFLAIRLSDIEAHDSKMEGTVAKNLTIMVVDDSPTVRKLISGKLEKCGHTVVAAADGAEALAKINEVVPDLILLDIMMPQMDGYQVCKLIRNHESTKDVPVIMISGKDGFFDKVRGRMAGTTGYITKPFGPETLMKTIETYVV